jgi:hypothetical protein
MTGTGTALPTARDWCAHATHIGDRNVRAANGLTDATLRPAADECDPQPGESGGLLTNGAAWRQPPSLDGYLGLSSELAGQPLEGL